MVPVETEIPGCRLHYLLSQDDELQTVMPEREGGGASRWICYYSLERAIFDDCIFISGQKDHQISARMPLRMTTYDIQGE